MTWPGSEISSPGAPRTVRRGHRDCIPANLVPLSVESTFCQTKFPNGAEEGRILWLFFLFKNVAGPGIGGGGLGSVRN